MGILRKKVKRDIELEEQDVLDFNSDSEIKSTKKKKVKSSNERKSRANINSKKANTKNKGRVNNKKQYKKVSAKVEEDEKIVKNYVVLRKELVSGYMRIEDLDLVGKIKLAMRYKDEKSGKEAERQKRQELKRIRVENSKYNRLLLGLQDLCKPIIDGESSERHVKLDAAYRSVLWKVIKNSDFNGLSFETPPYNQNLLKYMKDVPILLIIKKEGDGSVI